MHLPPNAAITRETVESWQDAAVGDDLATARQAARIVGISERRIRQLTANGTLSAMETSPLRVRVADCLQLREQRDRTPKPTESTSPPGLRDIVAEVAMAILPAAIEAANADRNAVSAMRDRIETELRDALAQERTLRTAAETRVAELESELAAAGTKRRWRK